MRRRQLLVAFGVFAACGEPYEGEIPISDPPGRDGGSDIDAGGAAADASEDSPNVADAGFDGDPCDRDHDGYRAKECDGGNDCDDDDDRAHPDAAFVADPPTPKTNGDWDCSGMVSKFFAEKVSCATTNVGACTQTQGFTGAVACGEAGVFVTCKVVTAIYCADNTTEARVQGCR